MNKEKSLCVPPLQPYRVRRLSRTISLGVGWKGGEAAGVSCSTYTPHAIKYNQQERDNMGGDYVITIDVVLRIKGKRGSQWWFSSFRLEFLENSDDFNGKRVGRLLDNPSSQTAVICS